MRTGLRGIEAKVRLLANAGRCVSTLVHWLRLVTGVTCRQSLANDLLYGNDPSQDESAFDSECAGLGGTPCVISGSDDQGGKAYFAICVPYTQGECSEDDFKAIAKDLADAESSSGASGVHGSGKCGNGWSASVGGGGGGLSTGDNLFIYII